MIQILAADIGGTNSRFAHFTADRSGALSLVQSMWLRTEDSTSLGSLLSNLKMNGFTLAPEGADIVVIAIAGPVRQGVYSSPPFIPWHIDISKAEEDFGFKRCRLINDFVAQAYACRSPVGESAEHILRGQIVPDAAAVVIGAGTALGKAALVPKGSGGFVAVPSEGGHTEFPFVGTREFDFQDFLIREFGQDHITANYVVSGRGLSYIHHFLTGEQLSPAEVTKTFSAGSQTLSWAARFYGRVCRNFSLEMLALGGVYIAGGIAARSPELLTHEAFAMEFRSSKTMSDILMNIPVFLMSDEESGLWGAALLGLQSLENE